MKRICIALCALTASLSLSAQQKIYPTSIKVSKDGSGDYTSIQAAVNSTRDLGKERVTIYIRNGEYYEKLVIPSWKTNVSLVGEDKDKTIITNNDYSGKSNPNGKVADTDKFSTFTSYTVLVKGNGFTAENLTFENSSGPVGQAVALHIEADRVAINNCNIFGYQDTLYAATGNSRQYFQECLIAGTTDFIFGEATVVFMKCTIKSLSNSFITAASTTAAQAFGLVFLDCQLIADSSVTKVFLGRPWRPHARTVFIHCEMNKHITAEGWDPWTGDVMFPDKDKTAFYAEFESIGPGGSISGRAPWSRQLSAEEAKSYTINNILEGADHWNPLLQLSR
jgi:pectinesterase